MAIRDNIISDAVCCVLKKLFGRGPVEDPDEDALIAIKNPDGTYTTVTVGTLSGEGGDVAGPASATDNAVVRFDLTTGKLIQNSSSILSDAGAFTSGAGTNALPTYSFSGDPDTGIYSSALDTIGLATGGTNRINISSSGVIPVVNNTYDSGSSSLSWRSVYTLRCFAGSGTAALPSYSFTNDSITGVYLPASDIIGISVTGVSRLAITATSLLPTTTNSYALGAASQKFLSIYVRDVLLTETLTGAAGMYVQITASRALTDADNGKILYSTSASVFTLSVPDSLTKPFQCGISQEGTGKMTVLGTGTAVAQNVNGLLSTGGQYAQCAINYRSGNLVIVGGATGI